MTSTRRIGTPESRTRAQLLDAAESLMLEEGYAAVTSRRVAARAGLKPQLVHYYFRSMDDLYLEIFRRRAEQSLDRYRAALESGRPLRALWESSRDPAAAVFNIEFTALANHRKVIRSEIAGYAERFRDMYTETVGQVLADQGIDPGALPPVVAMLAMTGVSQVLGLEAALGVTRGHEETEVFVERYLAQVESTGADPSTPEKAPPRRRPPARGRRVATVRETGGRR